jgi:hypothetical protein
MGERASGPSRRRWLTRAAALGALAAGGSLTLAGCGGGADRTKARLRLVNASGYADGLDLSVAGERRLGGVRYGVGTVYVDVDPQDAECRISRSGSPTSLLTLTPALAENRNVTLMAWGAEGSLRTLLIDDEQPAPDRGRSKLSVVHAAPDAEALDVYVTAADEALSAAVALHAGLRAGDAASFATLDSGTWRVRITAAGSKTDVRLDLPAVRLDSEGVATLVLAPTPGGVLVNAMLLRQKGAVEQRDNPEARVRVVVALPTGLSASVEVEGAALVTAQAAPSAGRYLRVPADTRQVRVSAGGDLFEIERPAFLPGGDYTLLVHGAQAQPDAPPRVSWIADDNRRRPDATGAVLRLVHGVSGLDDSTTLALTADFVPVAEAVARGAASAYAEVQASTTARLVVSASGASTALLDLRDQALAAGGVHTLFMVGTAGAVEGILRRDR